MKLEPCLIPAEALTSLLQHLNDAPLQVSSLALSFSRSLSRARCLSTTRPSRFPLPPLSSLLSPLSSPRRLYLLRRLLHHLDVLHVQLWHWRCGMTRSRRWSCGTRGVASCCKATRGLASCCKTSWSCGTRGLASCMANALPSISSHLSRLSCVSARPLTRGVCVGEVAEDGEGAHLMRLLTRLLI